MAAAFEFAVEAFTEAGQAEIIVLNIICRYTCSENTACLVMIFLNTIQSGKVILFFSLKVLS